MPNQYHTLGRHDGDPDIVIATTSVTAPQSNYIAALEDTTWELRDKGIKAEYLLRTGDCHVDDARNACVELFLKYSKAKRFMFIDDDVGWDAKDFPAFISHERDVVAGIYPKKGERTDDNCSWYRERLEFPVMTNPGEPLYAEPDGLVKVQAVPTGFLSLSRHCLETMSSNSVKYRLASDPASDHTPLLFERGIVDGRRWSGDYYFCRKWGELGGEIYVDPEIPLTHRGPKTWQGRLGSHWRKDNGIMDPRFDRAFRMLQGGDASDPVFISLAGLWGNEPWAAQKELVALSYMQARVRKTILETGSGLTTLAMAAAGADVWTLEHDMNWFRTMRRWIERLKLPNIHLVYAPLREYANGNVWYEHVPELPNHFDMAVIDGPPRFYDRSQLWESLGEQIKDALWLVDDVTDEDLKKYQSWGRETHQIERFAIVKNKEAS